MEKKILALFLTVVFVVGAGYLGYIFGQKRVSPQAHANALKFINSGLVNNFSVSVLGKIVSVSGTTLTIEREGSKISLEVPENTLIIRQPEILKNGSTPTPPEQIKLENLKTGDPVSVSVLLGSDDKIVSLNIMVLPESALESPSPVPVR